MTRIRIVTKNSFGREEILKKRGLIYNIVMLYGFSIAKIVFPLVTLPYLTRTLSVDTYGVVAYVKSIMTYMQLFIDFGFMLSGTKEIVLKKDNKKLLSEAVGDIFIARLLLCLIAFVALIVLSFLLPILRENLIYTILTFFPVVMTVFLFDYVFRGLERMQVITSRFILMKTFSTALTFVFVKSDSDLMLIPILEIIGSIFAIFLVFFELKKLKIKIQFTRMSSILNKLKESSIFFASSIASTVGGALSTILIGAFLSASDIAYWSAAIQIVNAVLALYNPIVDGVYPNIVKTHNYKVIRKILYLFVPLIIFGCLFLLFFSDQVVTIAFGDKYIASSVILKGLLPVLLFAFPASLIGWPMLGTIDKTKQVTLSTVIYGVFNISCLLILIVFNSFNLTNVIIIRCLSEFVFFMVRLLFCIKYKGIFKKFEDEGLKKQKLNSD